EGPHGPMLPPRSELSARAAVRMRMSDLIREAGWPVFPILLLGGGALLVALRHAAIPQRSLVPLALGLIAATVVMGFFGTALGMQASAEAIGRVEPERRWIFLIGLKESLGCLDVALALALPACLGLGWGSYRVARRLEEIERRS